MDRHIISAKFQEKGIREQIVPKNKKGIFVENAETLRIKDEYLNGKSVIELANELNRSTNYVWNILNKYDVMDSKRVSRTYFFDESKFESIDTEEKAYWLGFLYADGYVSCDFHEIEITLKKDDKSHLEKFLDFINPQPRPEVKRKTVKINGKNLQVWRATVFSVKMGKDLARHGCVPQKSLILRFPKNISDKYMNHFMRGYFDGDGCLGVVKSKEGYRPQLQFGIVGTKDFIYDYENYLIKNKALYRINKLQPTGKAFQSRHGGNIQGKKFYDYLYKDATVWLHRKKELFNAVLGGNAKRLLTGN